MTVGVKCLCNTCIISPGLPYSSARMFFYALLREISFAGLLTSDEQINFDKVVDFDIVTTDAPKSPLNIFRF